eukprot:SAG22_NODE_4908_length_1135_cov_1.305019_1_plen_111_part_10
MPCAARLLQTAPDPTVRRFAMCILSVLSHDEYLLVQLAEGEGMMAAVTKYAVGSTDALGCREVARLLRNIVRRDDLKEAAAALMPVSNRNCQTKPRTRRFPNIRELLVHG